MFFAWVFWEKDGLRKHPPAPSRAARRANVTTTAKGAGWRNLTGNWCGRCGGVRLPGNLWKAITRWSFRERWRTADGWSPALQKFPAVPRNFDGGAAAYVTAALRLVATGYKLDLVVALVQTRD
ncbi:hypothetical protein KL920_003890 [Ogataea angusta]|nr:hypothetical protein KL920_003890 [Ogataea angusta]